MPSSYDAVVRIVSRNMRMQPAELEASLRPASGTDMHAIAELRRSGGSAGISWDDAKYLYWRYATEQPTQPFGLLYKLDLGGEIVASIGIENYLLRLDGRLIDACSAMDLFVKQEYRETGLGAWLNLALQKRHPVVLALGANESSIGVARATYRQMAARRIFQLPIDVSHLVDRLIPIPLVARGISRASNLAFHFLQILRTSPSGEGKAEFLEVDTFGPEWDSVFLNRNDGAIEIARSVGLLNWRYVRSPRARYNIIAAYETGSPVGYAVLRMPQAPDRQHAYLADWYLAVTSRTDLARGLMSRVVRAARVAGATHVSATAMGSAAERFLRVGGMFARRNRAVFGVGCDSDAQLEARLSDASRWNLTGLGDDSDG